MIVMSLAPVKAEPPIVMVPAAAGPPLLAVAVAVAAAVVGVAPAPALGTDAVLPAEFAHTGEVAVIVPLGRGLIVTVLMQVLTQPLLSVIVLVNVKELPVPAVTVTG